MSAQKRKKTLTTYTGEEVEITYLQPSGDGARLDLEDEAGQRWRVDTTRSGEYEILTTWNSDGDLDDVDEPEWLDSIVSRLQEAGA